MRETVLRSNLFLFVSVVILEAFKPCLPFKNDVADVN